MGGGAVAGGEALAGDDEGGGVGAKVEEELGEDEDGEQAVGGDVEVGEAHDDEEDCEDGKAGELDRLAPDAVDGEDCDPVAWYGAG